MIDSIIAFSKSPMGEIIIRFIANFFIGAMGAQTIVMKVSDTLELFAKGEKAKRKIEALANLGAILGCIIMCVLTSALYSGDRAIGFVIAEGTIYGVGTLGAYWFLVSGKLKTLLSSIRKSKK